MGQAVCPSFAHLATRIASAAGQGHLCDNESTHAAVASSHTIWGRDLVHLFFP